MAMDPVFFNTNNLVYKFVSLLSTYEYITMQFWYHISHYRQHHIRKPWMSCLLQARPSTNAATAMRYLPVAGMWCTTPSKNTSSANCCVHGAFPLNVFSVTHRISAGMHKISILMSTTPYPHGPWQQRTVSISPRCQHSPWNCMLPCLYSRP